MANRKEQQQLFEHEQATESSGPVECLDMTFESDEARRAHFLQKLKEKLQDPEFKATDGFPVGTEEDILTLSDPPYYTACPNPFVAALLNSAHSPTRSSDSPVCAEPYVADIREGRGHPIYLAHSYHTKVPHQAIMRFILHYTEPGDVVLDGFCGTGMTGVAAQVCALPETDFRNAVEKEAQDHGYPSPRWGARRAVLVDLAPSATFVAGRYNAPWSRDGFLSSATRLLEEVESRYGWMFSTTHSDGRTGRINYSIWSEIFLCPECSEEVIYWDVAIDKQAGKVRTSFECPWCKVTLTKRRLERAFHTSFDPFLGEPVQQAKSVPVLINYTVPGVSGRLEKEPDEEDMAVLRRVQEMEIPDWVPTDRMPAGDEARRNDEAGYTHVHHFYTKRILAILAAYRSCGLGSWLPFSALTPRATRMHRIAVSRIGGPKKGEGGATVGVIAGTLYVPSISVEMNVLDQARDRVQAIARTFFKRGTSLVGTGSCTRLPCADSTVDYVFTDPPFGANLMYSELNFLWEAWLKVFSNNEHEAVISKTQSKGLLEYQHLMQACFAEYFRVLKPGRWMTVEFSNTKAAVWNAIQTALELAGFVVAGVSTLDKKQGSFKAITTPTAVKQDLIITCYKPGDALEEKFRLKAGTEEGVWAFVRDYLSRLPVFLRKDGTGETVAERQAHILFDRMVAFHVQRGVTVPVSAADFYAGLEQRFPPRDGMYFLSQQVAEYDRKRMTVKEVLQLQLFVKDEETAIQWLKQQLTRKPQTFQEIHPHFMKELGAWEQHERSLELAELLEQSFLRYDGTGEVPSQIHSYLSSNFRDLRSLEKDDPALRAKAKDRWYVPDPRKAGDLEKLRERALLREFEEYREAKQKKLKVFRLEAVRAGFKRAWQERNYPTIIAVARKIPETVLQEDPKLLMWFDQALTRSGEDA